jgi:hypothetical protein
MPSFAIASNGRVLVVEADNITRAVEATLPSLGFGEKPNFLLANVFDNGERGYWVSAASLFNDYYVTAKEITNKQVEV